SADMILGCDLVVTASNKVLETVNPDRTAVVYNTWEMVTGDFTKNPSLKIPGHDLRAAIEDRARHGTTRGIDAHEHALRLFGDSIMSNMFLLGFAYQLGLIPVHADAIEQAITLNAVAVDLNIQAFRAGRLAAHDEKSLARYIKPAETDGGSDGPLTQNLLQTLDERIAWRERFLADYQDRALARRYRDKLNWIGDIEREKAPGRSGLVEAVALSYFKLLAYKDEYEVARLYSDGRFEQQVRDAFDGDLKFEFHLAPPLFARKDKLTGHPRKMRLGPWVLPLFRLLAKGKRLRGSRWDLFGYSAERRLERKMIGDYEALLDEIAHRLDPGNHHTALALVSLPLDIKGFGHIKRANYETVKRREAELLREFRDPAPVPVKEAAE
ncbi:MAG TPA: indolepyruvate ferredoxin oxidoreductase family protein, partial [Rhizobiales bacterium]|nr:indolepyruvate ferredoxin oxidoreductase family protein [Hyphomicrobiales bacterium]